jgi:hypothetical protein
VLSNSSSLVECSFQTSYVVGGCSCFVANLQQIRSTAIAIAIALASVLVFGV